MRGRSLFSGEIGDQILWVMRGDRCLMWEIGDQVLDVRGDRCLMLRFRRSGFVDGEGRSLFDGEIGDRVLVVSGDSYSTTYQIC